MEFGAECGEDGVRFALWAPTAREVSLVLNGREIELPDRGNGWRRTVVADATSGDLYLYRVDGRLDVPDPASRFQPEGIPGPSIVVDPAAYEWRAKWAGRPWEEAVLYELHVGTATPEGTFAGLERRLPDLADLGITAIQLMPLAEMPGRRNWGYDGVLPFAPNVAYGTPDDLKHLIDRAHEHGLMVLLDVVFNHFGPSGNYLHAYAEHFFTERHKTPWGPAINCDGEDAETVRRFLIDSALYWLTEYRFDGLRLDAVHQVRDDSERHFLEEFGERVRSICAEREIHLVLENEANEARWLAREGTHPRLYTAQWDDDIHNAWHALLTGEDEGYYEDFADRPVERLGRALAEGFSYQGEISAHLGRPRGEPSAHLPPQAFVAFLQNHDQTGNRALGERLHHLVAEEKLALARAALLLAPQIPMLFMGEDWAASSPFQFFVDFPDEPDLQKAVREGRQREFARFTAFGAAGEVPDPTDEATFRRSRLDWDERRRAPHAGILLQTAELLALRREQVLPLIRSGFLGASWTHPHAAALAVEWRFRAGRLRLIANFGEDVVEVLPHPGERTIWKSSEAVAGKGAIDLSRWTGIVLTERERA